METANTPERKKVIFSAIQPSGTITLGNRQAAAFLPVDGVSEEELADAAGAPQLAATFEAYQQAAAAGADEAFGKKADMLAAYGDGPFYLVKFVPSYVATMGGVKTDASCQALGENGSVIPGLFAVGEATHRFMYNRSFVRHCSNSSALTMGRLTGAALATA